MGTANPLWGSPRIHGELLKLGIEVSERTVSRLLRRHGRPPSQTWRTFLTNHVTSLVSMDFMTVPTSRGRVLFVPVLFSHHRRRIVHFAIKKRPHRFWRRTPCYYLVFSNKLCRRQRSLDPVGVTAVTFP